MDHRPTTPTDYKALYEDASAQLQEAHQALHKLAGFGRFKFGTVRTLQYTIEKAFEVAENLEKQRRTQQRKAQFTMYKLGRASGRILHPEKVKDLAVLRRNGDEESALFLESLEARRQKRLARDLDLV